MISLISDASIPRITGDPSAYPVQQQYNIDPTYDAYSYSNEGSSDSTQNVFAFRPPQPRFTAPDLPVRSRLHGVQTSHVAGGPAPAHTTRPDIARGGAAGQLGTRLRSTAELRGYNSPLC